MLAELHPPLLAMRILDPHLQDGIHAWRDGRRFVKEGDKLYLEGTTTLAGRSVLYLCCSVEPTVVFFAHRYS